MQMDFWTAPVRSYNGNQYVLIITDRLSKYVFTRTLPSATAKDAAEMIFEDIILKFGAIRCLQSDQGSHFKNELLAAITKLTGCKQVFSIPYHPYNSGIHATTNFIPYELAFNRHLISSFEPPSSAISMLKPNDYWEIANPFKKLAIRAARLNIQQHQSMSKQRYDNGRTNRTYHQGELVWVRVLSGRSKFDSRFHGPFII
ncbi:unnamed protein product, partial [Didymodactylos carnosus]